MKTQAAAANCAKLNWNAGEPENILKLMQLGTLISGQLKGLALAKITQLQIYPITQSASVHSASLRFAYN